MINSDERCSCKRSRPGPAQPAAAAHTAARLESALSITSTQLMVKPHGVAWSDAGIQMVDGELAVLQSGTGQTVN